MPNDTYSPLLTTLAYILSLDGNDVLLIRRDKRPDDIHWGKYNGLGGKVEIGEDILQSLHRELYEEAGITVAEAVLRGTVAWPGFGKNGEDRLGFIFLVRHFSGTIPTENDEGTLLWKPLGELLNGSLNLWEGDRHFLPLVFDSDNRPFHGIMPYANGRPVSWHFSR